MPANYYYKTINLKNSHTNRFLDNASSGCFELKISEYESDSNYLAFKMYLPKLYYYYFISFLIITLVYVSRINLTLVIKFQVTSIYNFSLLNLEGDRSRLVIVK